MHGCIYTTLILQVECDTRSIFKWNKVDLNSEFTVQTGCLYIYE